MTDAPTINREQAVAVARLLRTIRREWDELATIRHVGQASAQRTNLDLADLVHGCIRTAEDTSALTPAALLHDHAERWQRSVRSAETVTERNARLQAQRDRAAEREREAEDPYREARAVTYSRGAALVRQSIAEARAARHTPEETSA